MMYWYSVDENNTTTAFYFFL